MPATKLDTDDIAAKLIHALQGDLTVYNFAQSDAVRSDTIDEMSNLIERTGTYLRVQEATPQQETVNLDEITYGAIASIGDERLYCECTPLKIHADVSLVEILIREIVNNAIKYSDGEVITTLHATDGYAVLRVEDFGNGLPQSTINNIAEPFIATTDERSGHGLGLALAWSIVQAHDGAMTVLTEPGQGTIVIVCLDLV